MHTYNSHTSFKNTINAFTKKHTSHTYTHISIYIYIHIHSYVFSLYVPLPFVSASLHYTRESRYIHLLSLIIQQSHSCGYILFALQQIFMQICFSCPGRLSQRVYELMIEISSTYIWLLMKNNESPYRRSWELTIFFYLIRMKNIAKRTVTGF